MSVFGLFVMLFLAWLMSNNKKKVDVRVVVGGLILQASLAFFILKTSFGQSSFAYLTKGVASLVAMSDVGSRFVFGENFQDHAIAFKVLPTIIFVSSLSSILFYLGVIQKIVSVLSWVMKKVMNISGSESLVTAANVFLGQTEAPLFIRPYLKSMTKSEVMTMMTVGMATVAGGVLAVYIGLGIPAGHVLAASILSAPAAVLLSKIIYPETEESVTKGSVHTSFEVKDVNLFEAACNGASSGVQLALNVGAMLITFIALIALLNTILSLFTPIFGFPITLEGVLGQVFRPIAFVMGVPWGESALVGGLLGEKMVLNEFVAYTHLLEYMKAGVLSERSVIVTTYALCGFANFSSIAIQIGGIGALEPSRKSDFALFGFKALLGATLAGFTTACVAGIFL
jgi:CNT family concentrative nucleoside transporter